MPWGSLRGNLGQDDITVKEALENVNDDKEDNDDDGEELKTTAEAVFKLEWKATSVQPRAASEHQKDAERPCSCNLRLLACFERLGLEGRRPTLLLVWPRMEADTAA